jgi:hypothetical protein
MPQINILAPAYSVIVVGGLNYKPGEKNGALRPRLAEA